MHIKTLVLGLAAALGLIYGPGNISAQGRKPAPRAVQPVEYSSWMSYRGLEKSADALRRHHRDLDHISLFAVHFDSELNLVPAHPWIAETLDQLKAIPAPERPAFFLTAVNNVSFRDKTRLKDPGSVNAILNSPALTSKHIDDLLRLSQPLQGVEIDYENVWFKDRELFSAFIEKLASRLHERGQKLIVVVQPKTYDSREDGNGAMDWPEISKHADMIKIKAYNYQSVSGKPGPLAPPNWVIDISNFALTQIPRSKLCIALNMEGYDWPESGEGKPIGYEAATRLARATGAGIQRDGRTQSPFFSYEMNGKHQVWFEDAASVQKKLDVLQLLGVQHVAIWRLGSGEDAIWNQLTVASK